MALGERILNASFGDEPVDHHAYVFLGDGRLMQVDPGTLLVFGSSRRRPDHRRTRLRTRPKGKRFRLVAQSRFRRRKPDTPGYQRAGILVVFDGNSDETLSARRCRYEPIGIASRLTRDGLRRRALPAIVHAGAVCRTRSGVQTQDLNDLSENGDSNFAWAGCANIETDWSGTLEF
jgi:hypothetical protein